MDIRKYKAKPNKTIEEHVGDLLYMLEMLRSYHYIEDGRIYELIKIACIYHDDGKANEEFQRRVNVVKGKLRFDETKEVSHNVLSGYFINPNDFQDVQDYYRVLFAVLYHHDFGDALSIMQERKELIESLLKGLPVYTIKSRSRANVGRMIYDDDAIKIKGFLHKVDYSASGGYPVEFPNDFLVDKLDNVKMKWKERKPSSDWNELQKFCMGKRDENIIVVAQTGMGKTEAGLQWIGNHKGYFVLPLRTAINAIYDRIRCDILQNEQIDTRISILHSESLEYYAKQLEDMEFDLFDYESRGKQFTIPLNISTMDQLFDFVFQYQGFELKLVTLSYSKIVIDEVQMYDPELLAYLIYGLKRICDMGGKVAVMTATMSPFMKELLMREISFNEENIRTFTDDTIRHNIQVYDRFLNAEDILKKYKDNEKQKKSSKILVVCNTIRKAQKLYDDIQRYERNIPAHILHSRYTRAERGKLEQEILEFGKTYDESGGLDNCLGIWISTSLVEASLDIDFDYLFTELQDLNSLFQRLGRCNRKGVKDVTDRNCYVYTKIEQSLLSGNQAYIDETIFLLSKRAIQTVDGQLSELKKQELIREFLTMENLGESQYYRKYKEASSFIKGIIPYKFEKSEQRLRNILSEDIIPSPVYEQHKEEIHEYERILLEDDLESVERMKVRSKIFQYSVNIPYWQWIEYRKAVQKGDAGYFPQICMGRREAIQVVECLYDELGYQKIDYKTFIRKAEML